MTTSPPSLRPFEAQLLPMLTEAAGDTGLARSMVRARPHSLRRYALVAVAAAALAVVVPMLTRDPLRGALAIEQRGDTIFVSVKDATADPEAMTNDLRAKGLPAKVEVVPVSPSLEGTWVSFVNDNLDAGYNDPRIVGVSDQISERPQVLKIPADFSTPFILVVGRPAEPGETYNISKAGDVNHAYECLGLGGMTPDEANETIEAKGYEPLWYYERSDRPETEVLDEVPSDKHIVGAEFLGPTTVIVHTADAENGHPAGSAAEGDTSKASC